MGRTADVAGVVVMMLVLCDGATIGRKPQAALPQDPKTNPLATINSGPILDKYPPYSVINQNSMYGELRRYPTGKWLRIKTRPHLADFYYKEIQEYINGNNSLNTPLALGTPMVIKFDLKPVHMQRFSQYQHLRQQALELSKRVQPASPTNSNSPGQVPKTAEQLALQNLTDTAYAQLLDLLSDNQVTVFGYLNKAYHANPPLPKNPDLSIITSSEFSVYSKGYYDRRGIEDSYEVAHNVTSQMNIPLTTYYLADYIYMYTGVRAPFYYEVWLAQDSAKSPLP